MTNEGWQPRRPLGADLAVYEPPLDSTAETRPTTPAQEPNGPLALRDVLALALLHNPELASASWDVRVAEAKRLQAGLPPNPEIAFDIETLGVWSTAERTLQLGQTIFLSGKLERQKKVAALERDLTGWDYEARRIKVYTDTAKAFAAVCVAQEKVALAEEILTVSRKMVEVAGERVRGGKTAPLEEMKARIELGAAKITWEQARHDLLAARQRLVAQWGSRTPRFTMAAAILDPAPALPTLEQLATVIHQNPDIARRATELQLRQAVARLEKTRAIPDLGVAGGWKQDGESGGSGFAGGVSLPLPLFDRNQGNIKAAAYGVAKAREDRRAAEARAETDLTEAYQAMASAHVRARIYRDEVLPETQKSFNAALAGYEQGKFAYLDVLDAQRSLFEARVQSLEAVGEFHAAAVNVEGLVGQSLESIRNDNPQSQENPS